jgi:hypothetical protein
VSDTCELVSDWLVRDCCRSGHVACAWVAMGETFEAGVPTFGNDFPMTMCSAARVVRLLQYGTDNGLTYN